jgi:hypothetical protein
MKKKVRPNLDNKYNKLFKFLTFDQSLFSSIFITFSILIYAFAILGVFFLLDIKIGQIE